jgi:molybdenum cofactor biosynthesis protein B
MPFDEHAESVGAACTRVCDHGLIGSGPAFSQIHPAARLDWIGMSRLGEFEKMPSESSEQHRKWAAERGPVRVGIVTVSDSRTPETDTNRHFLEGAIQEAGHVAAAYRLIRDEPEQVEAVLEELAGTDAQVLLWNGGTGISKRDTTYDVLSRRLEKVLPGFGEIFRMLSYGQVGAAAMLSRATAGTYRGKIVISTPGSPAAVRLAWEKLIAPEMAHLAWEIAR